MSENQDKNNDINKVETKLEQNMEEVDHQLSELETRMSSPEKPKMEASTGDLMSTINNAIETLDNYMGILSQPESVGGISPTVSFPNANVNDQMESIAEKDYEKYKEQQRKNSKEFDEKEQVADEDERISVHEVNVSDLLPSQGNNEFYSESEAPQNQPSTTTAQNETPKKIPVIPTLNLSSTKHPHQAVENEDPQQRLLELTKELQETENELQFLEEKLQDNSMKMTKYASFQKALLSSPALYITKAKRDSRNIEKSTPPKQPAYQEFYNAQYKKAVESSRKIKKIDLSTLEEEESTSTKKKSIPNSARETYRDPYVNRARPYANPAEPFYSRSSISIKKDIQQITKKKKKSIKKKKRRSSESLKKKPNSSSKRISSEMESPLRVYIRDDDHEDDEEELMSSRFYQSMQESTTSLGKLHAGISKNLSSSKKSKRVSSKELGTIINDVIDPDHHLSPSKNLSATVYSSPQVYLRSLYGDAPRVILSPYASPSVAKRQEELRKRQARIEKRKEKLYKTQPTKIVHSPVEYRSPSAPSVATFGGYNAPVQRSLNSSFGSRVCLENYQTVRKKSAKPNHSRFVQPYVTPGPGQYNPGKAKDTTFKNYPRATITRASRPTGPKPLEDVSPGPKYNPSRYWTEKQSFRATIGNGFRKYYFGQKYSVLVPGEKAKHT